MLNKDGTNCEDSCLTKERMPSEEEVRKFFQQAYYTTMSHDNETGTVNYGYNTDQCIYPTEIEEAPDETNR